MVRSALQSSSWDPPQYDLREECKSFFKLPGAIKFAGSEIRRREKRFREALTTASERYARGELTLEE